MSSTNRARSTSRPISCHTVSQGSPLRAHPSVSGTNTWSTALQRTSRPPGTQPSITSPVRPRGRQLLDPHTCQFCTWCLQTDTTKSYHYRTRPREPRRPEPRTHLRAPALVHRPLLGCPSPPPPCSLLGSFGTGSPFTHRRLSGHRNLWAERGRDRDARRGSAYSAELRRRPGRSNLRRPRKLRSLVSAGYVVPRAGEPRDTRASRRRSLSGATARAKVRPRSPPFSFAARGAQERWTGPHRTGQEPTRTHRPQRTEQCQGSAGSPAPFCCRPLH